MPYVDTSVLVAFYAPEAISETVEKMLIEAASPAISYLTEVELASAISRKVRDNQLSKVDGNKILALFQFHVEQQAFRLIPVEQLHFITAKNWISRFDTPLRTLDALHLAIASRENLPLFTADNQLKKAAEILGIESFSPEDL